MTRDQLHANRYCAYGGGRDDCQCAGNCPAMNGDVAKALLLGFTFNPKTDKWHHPTSGASYVNTERWARYAVEDHPNG